MESGRKVNVGKRNSSPLSGVCVCGHCGYRMEFKTRTRADKGQDRYFTLVPVNESVLSHPISISEGRNEASLLADDSGVKLVEAIDIEVLRKHKAKPPEANEGHLVTNVQTQIAELEKKIKRGSANLLLVEADVFADVQKELQQLKADLVKARNDV